MKNQRWGRRLDKWRGIERVEENLAPYEEALLEINRLGEDFARKTDGQLRKTGADTASFGSQGGSWVRQNLQRL